MKYESVKNSIEKIRAMDLSSAFIELFNKLVIAIKQGNTIECDMWINNLYPSVKLEDISSSDKEFIRDFFAEILNKTNL